MSKVVKHLIWEKARNNYILRISDSQWVSYNPDANASHFFGMFDELLGSENEDGEETALVDKADPEHTYRILVGDWRDAYEKLVPRGFDACVEFYYTKKNKYGGAWSTSEIDRAPTKTNSGDI